ncbi:alpha/beta hydrolase [Phytohabitans flavus]|uniref:Carboxylesterase n=1 Tax=Phytohabitans flavus TaxID=1076124 RepID=A0A6F8XSF9_9ACTN|nr:alpha/beta fold hydrolase [Phytohabitans flavus]BCB76729.1 carboxylesterase [Phytohabitans flavus]
MAADRISGFTSDKARQRFVRAYEDIRQRRLPDDLVTVDAHTSFGVTRVYTTGGDGTPFVLLPGAGGNALSWYPYVRRLRAARPVVAIDPVGEPGCSVQERPLHDGDDWARWLDETLAAQNVERAHLVGTSFGGWVALEYALRRPDHVETITLLDPAGFGRVTGRFLAWVMLGGLAAFTPRPVRRLAARALHNSTLLDDDFILGLRASMGFRRRHLVPPPFTDEQLRQVIAPTLAMLGERSQLYDAGSVATRIQAQIPAARTEVVPDAGHDLAVHCVDLVIDRAIRFAAAPEARA